MNTCASRKPRNAAVARCAIASAVLSLPGRSSHGLRLTKPWPVFCPAAPPSPPPATRKIVPAFFFSVRQQVLFDLVAHFERAGLGRAGGQTPLHGDAALVLARQEAAGQAQEQHDQQQGDERVDRQEQPLAVDHPFDVAGVALHQAVERRG